jgi:hypothetical protein
VIARALLLAALALAGLASPVEAQDLDRDGLPDHFEQALLDRFKPTLVLSADECDLRPARFEPGQRDPRLVDRDGTLYGQVTPRGRSADGRLEVEVKYFHLWSRDCGRPSHALDAEHVSALATGPDSQPESWQAVFWYAAAHQGTICDASSGAPASAVGAVTAGPTVYVSRGKHATYLDRGHCKWGCGSDSCNPGQRLSGNSVINLGEPDAPLNGTEWIRSRRWRLAEKMRSDFDPATRASLDSAHPLEVLALKLGFRAHQAPILGGDTGLDALVASADAAGLAISRTGQATGGALKKTAGAVSRSVSKTASGVAWFLRIRKKEK